MRNLVLLASLASVASACHSDPQILALPGSDLAKPGQMTVTGTATLEISPDCADLTMTLSSEAKRPGLATTDVQTKQGALVAALAKLGVEHENLKLSGLALNPVYTEHGELRGYRADITVTATTHDFGKIGSLMEAGADAGATSMSSAFRRSDLPELKKKVRDMAIAAARDKAKQTADALGIKLGRIVTVVENPGGPLWGPSNYVGNEFQVRNAGTTLGGSLQALTLDVAIGFELATQA
jgi:uncharacterized protein YggE